MTLWSDSKTLKQYYQEQQESDKLFETTTYTFHKNGDVSIRMDSATYTDFHNFFVETHNILYEMRKARKLNFGSVNLIYQSLRQLLHRLRYLFNAFGPVLNE